jgi:hypothetical protein
MAMRPKAKALGYYTSITPSIVKQGEEGKSKPQGLKPHFRANTMRPKAKALGYPDSWL